jgi:signal transduction histidine kinase
MLAWFTAIALLGIIALQAYWLVTSYRQQESRFSADIENAITAASVKLTLEQSGLTTYDSLTDGVSEIISTALGKVSGNALINHPGSHITIHIGDTGGLRKSLAEHGASLQNKEAVKRLFAGNTAALTPEKKFPLYKKLLDEEFNKRAIQATYELAVFDGSGHFISATCDTSVFKEMPLKYTGNAGFFSQGYMLQAAFPNANAYLIKRMAWLLSISILLIVAGGLSFSYLVVLFFRQKKFAEIRNDFLNNMTHELKTPISTVSVAIELIKDNRYPLEENKKQEFLSIAQAELKRLTMLVEKVLKTAAFEKSEITLSAEKFDAIPWLRETLLGCKPLFEASGADVETVVEPVSLLVYADKTHLTNILQNLLENAIKYNDKKKPKIIVSLNESDAFFELMVSDNGKGIPAHFIEKVFDKFFRVPSGDLHHTKGYGLGLSYVKSIAELHGGFVSARSVEEKGSIFTIRLPKLKT